MTGAQLEFASLSEASIKYWYLDNAFLDDTILYGVINYMDAKFDGSNWWMANFYDPRTSTSGNKTWDITLLEELFRRYDNIKIEDAHPSVIENMKSKENLSSQRGQR